MDLYDPLTAVPEEQRDPAAAAPAAAEGNGNGGDDPEASPQRSVIACLALRPPALRMHADVHRRGTAREARVRFSWLSLSSWARLDLGGLA